MADHDTVKQTGKRLNDESKLYLKHSRWRTKDPARRVLAVLCDGVSSAGASPAGGARQSERGISPRIKDSYSPSLSLNAATSSSRVDFMMSPEPPEPQGRPGREAGSPERLGVEAATAGTQVRNGVSDSRGTVEGEEEGDLPPTPTRLPH